MKGKSAVWRMRTIAVGRDASSAFGVLLLDCGVFTLGMWNAVRKMALQTLGYYYYY
jgi:uncharacterized membrane protein YiaA